jgi:hypothetical protein
MLHCKFLLTFYDTIADYLHSVVWGFMCQARPCTTTPAVPVSHVRIMPNGCIYIFPDAASSGTCTVEIVYHNPSCSRFGSTLLFYAIPYRIYDAYSASRTNRAGLRCYTLCLPFRRRLYLVLDRLQ